MNSESQTGAALGTHEATDKPTIEEAESAPPEISPQTLTNNRELVEAREAVRNQSDETVARVHEEDLKTKPLSEEENYAAMAAGFTDFRLWVNRRIRQRQDARGVTLKVGDQEFAVTEITSYGKVRAELRINAESASDQPPQQPPSTLISFDERVIPTILAQIL